MKLLLPSPAQPASNGPARASATDVARVMKSMGEPRIVVAVVCCVRGVPTMPLDSAYIIVLLIDGPPRPEDRFPPRVRRSTTSGPTTRRHGNENNLRRDC